MKKLFLILTGIIACLTMYGQAKKPELMVVPSIIWCNDNGYTQQYETMWGMEDIPDYRTAIRTNRDLVNVISKIGILMTDRGFPLKDLSQTITSIERNQAMNLATASRSSSGGVIESPLDLIKRQANADILIEVDWAISINGPRRTVTYTLRGLDAYTNKQIAAAQGTGAPSFAAEIPVLLEEAVLVHMENFADQLQGHFDDLFNNGREVSVDVIVFENDDRLDLETEFGGRELTEIIDDWMAENTVNHRYSKFDGSDNFINFEQVRIPLLRTNGMPMDTESFVRELSNFLRAEPYKVPTRVQTRGLGRCVLIIGDR